MPGSLFPKERKGPNGRTLAWNISNTVKQNKSKKQTPLFALMKFSSLKELHSSPKCGDWGRYSDVASALMEAVLNGLATACLRCFDRQLPPPLCPCAFPTAVTAGCYTYILLVCFPVWFLSLAPGPEAMVGGTGLVAAVRCLLY